MDMQPHSRATLSFWSIDAFIYLLFPGEKPLSSEIFSRISAFIDAYVLFDEVVIPERYRSEPVIQKLGAEQSAFTFYSPQEIVHSDDLTRGLTLDIDFDVQSFEKMSKDNMKWYAQHNPAITEDDWSHIENINKITMTHLRLWQRCLVNEISDTFSAIPIVPASLQGIDAYSPKPEGRIDIVLEKYRSLENSVGQANTIISRYMSQPKSYILENFPPFLSLFIDQSINREHSIDILIGLRRDFSELRELRGKFQRELSSAIGPLEQKNVIEEWNSSWETILKGTFKKPSLLQRKMSSSEVGKTIANTAILSPSALGFLAGLTFDAMANHLREMKAFKRFQMFSNIYSEVSRVTTDLPKLRSTFGVESFKRLDKK